MMENEKKDSLEIIKAGIAIVVVVFALVMFLVWLDDCAGQELCYPTPSPFPPDTIWEPGDHLIPSRIAAPVDIEIRADGHAGVMTFANPKMELHWTDDPPEWFDAGEWPSPTYWYLTDDPNPGAFCRFDCTNRNTDPDAAADWLCKAECWSVFSKPYTGPPKVQEFYFVYRHVETTDCGENWSITSEGQADRYVPREATVRQATRRVKP